MNRRFALGTQMQIENNTGLKFIGESVIPSKEREFNKLRLNARERHVRKQGNVRSRCGSKSCASILYFISRGLFTGEISSRYFVSRASRNNRMHNAFSPVTGSRIRWNLSFEFFLFFYYSIPFFSPRVPPRRYISYGLSYLTNSRAFKFQMYPVHQKISTMNRWRRRLDRKIFPQSNFYYALFPLVRARYPRADIIQLSGVSLNKPL